MPMPSAISPGTAVRCLLAASLSAALAGCNDPSVERGTPPVPVLQAQRIAVPLYSYGAARRLRESVDALANGDPSSLRAVIRTTSGAEAQAARQRLIADGCDPTTITVQSVPYNDIVVSRVDVRTASCRTAIDPGWLGDAANSVDSLGRCVQASNLAAMVVMPADLVSPGRLAPGDGAVAARAVIDWQKGDVKTPQTGTSTGDLGGTGGGGDEGGGDVGAGPGAGPVSGYAPRTGTTTTAPAGTGAAPAVNPLLTPGL